MQKIDGIGLKILNSFKAPVYTELERRGVCHEPTFFYSCKVHFGTELIEMQGSGKAKRVAKRTAAEEVLKCLEEREYPLSSLNSHKKVNYFFLLQNSL